MMAYSYGLRDTSAMCTPPPPSPPPAAETLPYTYGNMVSYVRPPRLRGARLRIALEPSRLRERAYFMFYIVLLSISLRQQPPTRRTRPNSSLLVRAVRSRLVLYIPAKQCALVDAFIAFYSIHHSAFLLWQPLSHCSLTPLPRRVLVLYRCYEDNVRQGQSCTHPCRDDTNRLIPPLGGPIHGVV